jgi:hypothetical protein
VKKEKSVIVRTWHGCVPLKHAAGFHAHLLVTGVQHALSIAGNLGAEFRQETQENMNIFPGNLLGKYRRSEGVCW